MKGARVGVLTAIAGFGLLGLTACSGNNPAPRVQIPQAQQQDELPIEEGPRPNLVAAEVSSLGKVMTNQAGMTLYMFTKDTVAGSTCYNQCATQWKPLIAEGKEITFTGLPQEMVGTTKRKDGTRQITVNKMPVYTYAKDLAPGDANGQGMNSQWYAVTPQGKQAQGLATQAEKPQQQQQPKPQQAPANDYGSGY